MTTLINRNSPIKVTQCIFDIAGTYIITVVEKDEQEMAIVNLYAPNQDTPEYFVNIMEKVDKLDTPN